MEKLSFKKFYKFIVSKPFEIQPRYPFIEVGLFLFMLKSNRNEKFKPFFLNLEPKLFERSFDFVRGSNSKYNKQCTLHGKC